MPRIGQCEHQAQNPEDTVKVDAVSDKPSAVRSTQRPHGRRRHMHLNLHTCLFQLRRVRSLAINSSPHRQHHYVSRYSWLSQTIHRDHMCRRHRAPLSISKRSEPCGEVGRDQSTRTLYSVNRELRATVGTYLRLYADLPLQFTGAFGTWTNAQP